MKKDCFKNWKYSSSLLLGLMLAGCASGPSAKIIQASQQFQKVDRAMPRAEVYRLLGEPQTKFADGREQWQVTDKHDSATLDLNFDSDGRVSGIGKRYPMVKSR